MNKRLFLAAVLAVFVATPALAGHCPADVRAIDAALGNKSLAAAWPKMLLGVAKMTEVKALRDKGAALHKAGKHKESTNTLAKAMRILLTSK